MVKVFFNNSCNICRTEINHYKKHSDKNLEWIDVTDNIEAQKITSKSYKELLKRMQRDPSADRHASTKKVIEAIGGKMISYEWVRGRFDVVCCVEGDAETVVGMKVAFLNSGLMDDLMIHEVIDYNKAFTKAADGSKSVVVPAE